VKSDPRDIAFGVVACLAVAAGAAVLYQQAARTPESMPQDEFARTVRKLRSDAVEARMLAQALAAGALTRNFAVEQHTMLIDDLADVRKALDKPPPRDAVEDARRTREAVARLEELLGQVPVSLTDAAQLRRIAAGEEALAASLPRTEP
jgi:hypothetical protein